MQVYTVKDTSSTTTWLPDACSSIVSSVCMSFQSRAQDVWLEGHHSEERAAIFLQPLVLQTQTTLPLSHSRASSLMRGASGITVVMRLRTLMTHVTAYGVEWKRRYGLQGRLSSFSVHTVRTTYSATCCQMFVHLSAPLVYLSSHHRAQDVW